jgi:PadR family transcriptional regulator PadR
MMYRKQGTLLPLERQVLEIAVTRQDSGVYGFSLAQELAGERGETRLVSHGTLYKALDRMRRAGLLVAEWEPAEAAAEENRPRRRVYRVTVEGARALEAARAASRPAAGWKRRWHEYPGPSRRAPGDVVGRRTDPDRPPGRRG